MPSIAQLEKLLSADPHDAFVLYGLALEHAKAGRYELALGFFDRSLASDPASGYAYYHKARALSAMGRREDAARTIHAGIEAAERAGDAHAAGELRALLGAAT